ncbi:unnamed protein product [Moneuplotes crassus]|uniref:Uncharacterized protein n=1 Tax=Euplotes crassus TaxID=5936 RepID=A0AAD1XBT8_EUPCR|nr:unnamed protein product [Moneuplotes crassus]
MYIKDRKISELENSDSLSATGSLKDADIAAISDKIRSEYIHAIETLETNLSNLRVKYQSEVDGRKEDFLKHKEETRDLKRKIQVLKESTDPDKVKDTELKDQLLAVKAQKLQLEEEKELLNSIVASTKAAWAQSELEKEEIQMKYSKKEEEVNLYRDKIAELELQVMRGKQDLEDLMETMEG